MMLAAASATSEANSTIETTHSDAKRARMSSSGASKENFSVMNSPANGIRTYHGNKTFGGQIGPGGNGVAAGAKKLVIKNLKKKNALPDNYEERSVAKLQKAVIAIQRAERIDTSLEELYQAVENLCSHGKAEQVYANLRELVEAHVQVLYTSEINNNFINLF